MAPRLHIADDASPPLAEGQTLSLPAGAARHVQVLRLQPGAALCLFDGRGGQWPAQVLQMGRSDVQVQVLAHEPVEREIGCRVTLALGMPANERMDSVVEKATELGAAALLPLVCERSVLRVAGERAERKAAHWQAIAISACEQSGRNRVPQVAAPQTLRAWLDALPARPSAAADPAAAQARWLLSLQPDAQPLVQAMTQGPAPTVGWASAVFLSGPEGGLSPAEEAAARARGFMPVTLGRRVLRADTAPLAALACIAAWAPDI